ALETFNTTSEKYFYNTASIHQAGKNAAKLLEAARKQILDLMYLPDYDLVFTSSATESNNIAILSTLRHKKQFGKTILTSELEHPSIVNVLAEMKD
ncbi:aminotransferase class V-fold PLP-dependent enzyme, partial [Salmonella enterica subsp. enterica serovar Typhimurium]